MFKGRHVGIFVVLGLAVFLVLSQLEAKAQSTELPSLELKSPVSGFTQPVVITHAGDGTGRLFVVEQTGRIRIVKDGALLGTPFLDITTKVSTGFERGLLGLAFPPAYASKGYFYVNYTNTAGHTVVARYRRSATNPDVADPASEQIVLFVEQPFANHNGGQLAFGPRDGFLYIGMGDGGSGNDPGNRAQNPNELLGKILRIDTETGKPQTYNVPSSNPFVNQAGVRPEIWALGMRNPWRFSFDRLVGDLYVADVGQGAREEVNFQSVASAGGENYGWRVFEGTLCTGLGPAACTASNYVMPVTEYDHSLGCSVTGGYVYRGSKHPLMQGLYIYGDFCSGRIWGLRRVGATWQNNLLLDTNIGISTFGEDEAGNLYVANHSGGQIFQVSDTKVPATTVAFSATSLSVGEGEKSIEVTVRRSGNTTTAGTVSYATLGGSASETSDYTTALGTLRFAANELEQKFRVLITDDALREGNETLSLALLNTTGGFAVLDTTPAVLTIIDNDASDSANNPIDDAGIFVRQHYLDFFNREPDDAGLQFWTSNITSCGTDTNCRSVKRIDTSAAFFLSIEFQGTGYFVHRVYKASYGDLPGKPVPVRFQEFMRDKQAIGQGLIVGEPGWEQELETNKTAFVEEWVQRPEFLADYPSNMTAEEYVGKLFQRTGVSPTVAERQAAVNAFGGGGVQGRARALRSVAESQTVYQSEYNRAFVLMQYFGYLRRNPNDPPEEFQDFRGYAFWLNKLNEFGGDFRAAEMVKSFLVSTEYRARFGRP